jgi:hypothetical protein
MPFTADERKKISEMLREKGVPEKVPVVWSGRIPLARLNRLHTCKAMETLGGQVEVGWFHAGSMPCLILICNNCGNTLLLNLKVAGLWDELRLEEVRLRC